MSLARTLIPRSTLAATPTSRALALPRSSQPIRASSSSSSSSSTKLTRSCPACSTPVPLPTSPCPSCSKLLPIPNGLSHHSMLYISDPASSAARGAVDLPLEFSRLPAYGFDLDVKDLRNKMLRRQMELHPDKYSGKDQDVLLARELSGRVNGAYETLRDPLRRAEYLLSASELEVAETESLTDPMLLAEILEAREELEGATSTEEVDEIRQTNAGKVRETLDSLLEAFSAQPPNLKEAKSLAVQLKYWQGLEEAAKEWTPKS